MIPTTNPFLKNLFEECTRIGETQRDCLDLEELGVTELVKMLKDVNIEAILQDFGKLKRIEDPVIHFYEDFLREYDPKQKVKRGIFYTPDPVVSFIVRSVDYLLRTEFDCQEGLAETSTIPVSFKHTKVNGEVIEEVKQVPKVQILDPATGTGTFLKYVIEEIKKTFDEKHKDLSEEELRKEWNIYVDKHLLPRVFGFELLMAPYAIAHLKLGLKLKETGYEFLSHQRLGVALTNALESGRESAETLDSYLGWLAQESIYSNYIKTAKNISVILGNPPYSVSSLNKGPHIERLMNDYKADVKEERNIQPLSDDYIKFIRSAHKYIDDNGFGISAMITNNAYLSGIIHRGMRRKLYETFDEIYILNLHGSLRIGEKTPEGGKDENVFDIQQGVAIVLYVKLEKSLKEKKIYYADLWGLRKDVKYPYLFENDVKSVDWLELKPREPYYFFVPKDFGLQEEYDKFWSVVDVYKKWSSGVKTHRDHFVVGFTKDEIIERLGVFTSDLEDGIVKERLKLKDTGGWKLSEAKKKIHGKELESEIYPYAYRPFDVRYVCYESYLIDRPRLPFMEHLLKENLALAVTRILAEAPFMHVYVSCNLSDICLVSTKTKETAYLFPLYLYPEKSQRKPEKPLNFTDEFIRAVKETLCTEPTPEEIFHYIYAVLYSPTYRKRYEEFLKIDFPSVPLTSDSDLFKTLCRFGSELVSLHLMESQELDNLITVFKGEGDNVVAAIGKNSYKNGKLKINKTQYFEGMPEEVYNFHIGGYQVCEKWLKDRKGRKLTGEEIEHYQKIVVALNETIRIMEEIDKVIEEHGGWPVR
jgi:predicted helicase